MPEFEHGLATISGSVIKKGSAVLWMAEPRPNCRIKFLLVIGNGLGDTLGTPVLNRHVNAKVASPIPARVRLDSTFDGLVD